MAHWVQITPGSGYEGGVINLDQGWAVRIIPTFADPSKYALAAYQNGDTTHFETLLVGPSGGYTSAAAAQAGLEGLLGAFSYQV